jgi:hypothetical protein
MFEKCRLPPGVRMTLDSMCPLFLYGFVSICSPAPFHLYTIHSLLHLYRNYLNKHIKEMNIFSKVSFIEFTAVMSNPNVHLHRYNKTA